MSNRYRDDPEALRGLVRDAEVHRDVYIDPEVFATRDGAAVRQHLGLCRPRQPGAESGRLFHARRSATQPVLMVRHTDGAVQGPATTAARTRARASPTRPAAIPASFFRCPYHAWSFRTDGSLLAMPLRRAMRTPASRQSHGAQGMTPVRHVHNYRGFVFAKLSRGRPGFRGVFSAIACPASTTWSTARRPDGSKSPAACCATCTTATGKCWSRTRPTPAIRWSRT